MDRTDTSAVRAQAGLGTLVVLVSMVLVAAIAAGVLINTVALGADGSGPAGTGGDRGVDRLLVVDQRGTVLEDGRVRAVNLTVTTGPGGEPIDLRDATVTWVGPRGAASVAASGEGTDSPDGSFGLSVGEGSGDSPPVLDGTGDRAVLTFDLGETDDVASAEEFATPLRPGEMVSVTIATGDGASTTTRLAVPRSPSGDGDVVL